MKSPEAGKMFNYSRDVDRGIVAEGFRVVNVPLGRTLTAFLPVFAFNVRVFGTLTTFGCEATGELLSLPPDGGGNRSRIRYNRQKHYQGPA